jgi:hypothetical protein
MENFFEVVVSSPLVELLLLRVSNFASAGSLAFFFLLLFGFWAMCILNV